MANKQIEEIREEQGEQRREFAFEEDELGFERTPKAPIRKKSPIESFANAVIPMKSDTAGEIIRKIVLLVSLVVFIACLVIIFNQSAELKRQDEIDNVVVEVKENTILTGQIPLEEKKVEEIKEEVPGILDAYVALYEMNPDIVGWVKIDGTNIDYPVMQAEDNDFYLFKDFNKNYSVYGSIYADYHVPVTAESRPNNTVLYGHNIEGARYFAQVTRYFPQYFGGLGFYKEHPTVTFDTIYEEGTYKIFAGMFANTKEQYGEVYDYYRKRSFPDKESFYDFVGNIMDRSTFYTDVDVEYGDEILTLSTCYYPLGKEVDSRYVIFARRVREGESKEVNVDNAYINPSPRYFDYYYKVNNKSWAGRTWDTSLVKGFDEFVAENPDAPIANPQG